MSPDRYSDIGTLLFTPLLYVCI